MSTSRATVYVACIKDSRQGKAEPKYAEVSHKDILARVFDELDSGASHRYVIYLVDAWTGQRFYDGTMYSTLEPNPNYEGRFFADDHPRYIRVVYYSDGRGKYRIREGGRRTAVKE